MLGVRRPVGGQVPWTTVPHSIGDQANALGLNQASLLVTGLGPWIGEEAADPGKAAGTQPVLEHLHGIARDHPHVGQSLLMQVTDQVADAWRVDIDREESELWLLRGHLCRGDSSAEADLENDGPSLEERVKIEQGPGRQQIVAVLGEPALLALRDASATRLVRADRRVARLSCHRSSCSIMRSQGLHIEEWALARSTRVGAARVCDPEQMAQLSFESLESLRMRRSAKWQAFGPDVIPAWVAEMDYAMDPAIAEALHAAIDRSDTGYAWPEEVGEALAVFGATRWGWLLDPAHVIPVADVLTGVGHTLIAVTEPGDAVVINSPVYPPFFTTVAKVARRTVIDVPLVWNGARHVLDLAGLEREFARPEVTAYLLCTPQNPTGLVYSKADFESVAELAGKHGVLVVADEIHAPMAYPGVEFWPYLAVSGDRPAVSVISASKAWNIAGLKCAQIVASNAELAARLRARIPQEVQHGAGHLGSIAAVVAYTQGQPWLDALVAHLSQQADLLAELLAMHLPLIRSERPLASYLAWLDCRAMDLGPDPAAFFLERAKVALNSGPTFGPSGEGFVRLNFANSPELLTEIITRMAAASR